MAKQDLKTLEYRQGKVLFENIGAPEIVKVFI